MWPRTHKIQASRSVGITIIRNQKSHEASVIRFRWDKKYQRFYESIDILTITVIIMTFEDNIANINDLCRYCKYQ